MENKINVELPIDSTEIAMQYSLGTLPFNDNLEQVLNRLLNNYYFIPGKESIQFIASASWWWKDHPYTYLHPSNIILVVYNNKDMILVSIPSGSKTWGWHKRIKYNSLDTPTQGASSTVITK